MKQISIIILMLTAGVHLISCKESRENTKAISENVTVEEFSKLMNEHEGIILDVRTPEEFANGSIPEAVNINFYDDNFKNKLQELDTTQAVYVYCAKGGRSSKSMKMLADMGFNRVYNLSGGYTAWEKVHK